MAIKQHGATKLVWDAVGGGEFHAGGLTRHFSITLIDGSPEATKYSMSVRTGDEPSIFVGVFSSLEQAKFRAQRILDQGIGK